LADDAEATNDEADKDAAKAKVMTLKKTLAKLKNNVINEANLAKSAPTPTK